MQIRARMICIIFGLCFFCANSFAAYQSAVDTTKDDTEVKEKMDYENVTVAVKTDWGVSDKHDNVDVKLVWAGKKVKEVIVYKEHSTCTISLISGLVITITDPKTGKVLRRFK